MQMISVCSQQLHPTSEAHRAIHTSQAYRYPSLSQPLSKTRPCVSLSDIDDLRGELSAVAKLVGYKLHKWPRDLSQA
jgi:hypothetical protein